MSTTIEIGELAQRWQEMLDLAAQGHEIIVSNGAQAPMRVIPVAPRRSEKRIAGLHRGMIDMSENFNDPVDPETWE